MTIPVSAHTFFHNETPPPGYTKLDVGSYTALKIIPTNEVCQRTAPATGSSFDNIHTEHSISWTSPAPGSLGSTTLTPTTMGGHTHTYNRMPNSMTTGAGTYAPFPGTPSANLRSVWRSQPATTFSAPTTYYGPIVGALKTAGGGLAHSHPASVSYPGGGPGPLSPFDFRVNYVDLIVARRDS